MPSDGQSATYYNESKAYKSSKSKSSKENAVKISISSPYGSSSKSSSFYSNAHKSYKTSSSSYGENGKH
ncbi:hypothetical protein SPBR_09152 [Sporothrix brasiliensis 5110]|uniref:Uncharacterized protein n=1 Tax=Sporothrix brasiliensis 5110 TaxID=1398154 RepID=A0A0C2IUN6_9PEZI|nr:uncharacterized protein SPBR_09152 [Sporothrix brasiliensis 5110]KIH92871.1 hypothetical protein SPBR_09152 [Sporothrix brasiliensis 5110]